MPDLATPAIAELHAWLDAQNPLVATFVAPLIEHVSGTYRAMQEVIDALAVTQEQVAALTLALQKTTEDLAVANRRIAELTADAAEHAIAKQVLMERIDQTERQLYGPKSERRKKVPNPRVEAERRHRGQLTADEKEARRKAAAEARKAKLDALQEEVVDLPLPPETPEGRPLPPLCSTIFEWRRGRLVRLAQRREQRVLDDGTIATAPAPPQVVEGGSYGPGLHAKVTVDKCLDAMPLRRQERAFARMGAPIPVSALCAMFHRCASAIEPLYKALIAHVRAVQHVAADETPQPVLDDEKVRKGWMWVFAVDDALLYVYSPSRGGKVADGILGPSTGTLTVDGYTGYNLVTKEGRRTRSGCWAHGRRGLFEARGYATTVIDRMLGLIDTLFDVEHEAIEVEIVGTAEHLALRQGRSADAVDQLYKLLETTVSAFDARSSVAKAMNYLILQRAPLTHFLVDASVPIHNNLSERALRVIALLRKNALFVGNDESGRNYAMLMSMVATCQLHGVDPELWLADVLIAVSERGVEVGDLMPWQWKVGRGASLASADTA